MISSVENNIDFGLNLDKPKLVHRTKNAQQLAVERIRERAKNNKISSQPKWRTSYIPKSHNLSHSPTPPSIRDISLEPNFEPILSGDECNNSLSCDGLGGDMSSSEMQDKLNDYSVVVIPPPLLFHHLWIFGNMRRNVLLFHP